MQSAFFGYFQSSPTTNNTIPTASTPTSSVETPLAARRMAPKNEMMHPISMSLSFIAFVSFHPLSLLSPVISDGLVLLALHEAFKEGITLSPKPKGPRIGADWRNNPPTSTLSVSPLCEMWPLRRRREGRRLQEERLQ
jgi:hypothetical protein